MKNSCRRLLILCVSFFTLHSSLLAAERGTDTVVFGATPAGIMASIAAARKGDKVTLLEPSYIVGGMMSGGLTKTDIGNRHTVGGLSLEFFKRVRNYYAQKYGSDSEQVKACKNGFFFEPKVADLIFSEMLTDAGVTVLRKQQLVSCKVSANRITAITTKHYETQTLTETTAAHFIDATYEGDLMAAANVPYRVGREAACEYNETLAGITTGPYAGKGDHRVQAYNFRSTITNRPDVLRPFPKPKYYNRDAHYSYIEAVKRHNMHSFEELFHDAPLWGPVNGKSDPNKADYPGANYAYAEADYEMRAVISQRVSDYWLSLWYMLQNDPELPEDFKASARKWGLPTDEFTESNNVSPQMYVREARRMLGAYMLRQSDLERDRYKPDAICMGSYNIDSHDVALFRNEKGGITADGYLISSVDPYEIPYRSITPIAPENLLVTCAVSATHIAYGSLRMEPVFMMIGQAAGLASRISRLDKVPVQKIDTTKLQTQLTELGIPHKAPFRPVVEIIAPETAKVGEPIQLIAKDIYVRSPLTLHWNFDGAGTTDSQERAPTFTPAHAKTHTISLKAIDKDGNISLVDKRQIKVGGTGIEDISILVKDATLTGRWDRGSAIGEENRQRINYHDLNSGKKTGSDLAVKTATFTASVPVAGRYRVAFAFQQGGTRATNTPVTIRHADGDTRLTVNQRKRGTVFVNRPLGDYRFTPEKPAQIIVTNENANGHVSIDEIRLIYLGP